MVAVELEEDQDHDSLFGSPPPSPRLPGRAPSPALALPNATSTSLVYLSTLDNGSQTQREGEKQKNVGTIALPGSQLNSELPIHPLALSLSHAVVNRPPAPLNQGQSASTEHATVSRLSSTTRKTVTKTTPRDKTARKRQHSSASSQSRSRSASTRPENSTPAPAALEFPLPDPSAPPPTHFLRNQANLLGKAGRVAGVKPTALMHIPGSTPSNPICIDDEDRVTAIESISSREKTSGEQQQQQQLHPFLANEEIVSVLLAQKNIVPVLENLLKLSGRRRKVVLGSRAPGIGSRLSFAPSPSPSEAFALPPVSKKRKLTHVPAGASDWDVPFPFDEGEGPEYYRQTWEKERGCQLASELVKMVRSAAGKALAKKGIPVAVEKGIGKPKNPSKVTANPTMETKANGHYRPMTTTHGVNVEAGPINPQPTPSTPPATEPGLTSGMTSLPSPAVQTPHSQPEFQSLDQFPPSTMGVGMSSTTATIEDVFPVSSAPDVPTLMGPLPSHPSLEDQSMFDTWMKFLDAFPITIGGVPFLASASSSVSGLSVETSGTSSPATTSTISTPTTAATTPLMSLCSMPTLTPEDFDYSDVDSFFQKFLNAPGLDFPAPQGSVSSASNVGVDVSSMLGVDSPSTCNGVAGIGNGEMRDDLIDPTFSSLMVSTTTGSSSEGSMMPAWDGTRMIGEGPGGDAGGGQGGQVGIVTGGGPWPMSVNVGSFGELTNVFQPNPTLDPKGKGREVVNLGMHTAMTPVSIAEVTHTPPSGILTQNLTPFEAHDTPPTNPGYPVHVGTSASRVARLQRKDEIIEQAKEKRARVHEELDVVKRRLWQTTIERAGLLLIARGKDT